MSEFTWVVKSLSSEGYLSDNFETMAMDILNFRRTLVPVEMIPSMKAFFKEIKVPVRVRSIVNYPEYMKELFKQETNPFCYRIVFIPKNIGIPVTEIKDWVDRARSFYKYRRK